MKRESYLFEKIIDIDNLRHAFWKARKSKDWKNEVIVYRKKLDKNLLELKQKIEFNSISLGKYHYFTIFEPKERNICAASFEERIVHHAIMNVCHNYFSKYQIANSFASQKGKGTYAAIEKAKFYQKKYTWFLKMDVKKYFDKIDHAILKKLLQNRFKDQRLLKLLGNIIDSYHVNNPLEGKGVPIGNLTSQYFANHYLGYADHYITEILETGQYVRYMDDMVVWSNDKSKLLSIGYQIQTFLKQALELDLKPFCLNITQKGLPFLGYVIFPDYIKINKNSKKRFIKKFKMYILKFKHGIWTQKQLNLHLLPLLSFVTYAKSYNLRKKIVEKLDIN